MDYYIAFVDNTFIFTTQNIYDQCLAEGKIKDLSENLNSTPLADALKKGGIVLDFQTIASNELLNQMKNDRDVNTALIILKSLEYLTVQSENMEECEAILTLKDSNKNALEQMITIGISVAMAYR